VNRICRKYDFVWTHSVFEGTNGPFTKVYLAKKDKETGELVEPGSKGPGQLRLVFPYGQVWIMTTGPRGMTNLDKPSESIVFVPKVPNPDKPCPVAYDPIINADRTAVAE
jgi:hypothetical protein